MIRGVGKGSCKERKTLRWGKKERVGKSENVCIHDDETRVVWLAANYYILFSPNGHKFPWYPILLHTSSITDCYVVYFIPTFLFSGDEIKMAFNNEIIRDKYFKIFFGNNLLIVIKPL